MGLRAGSGEISTRRSSRGCSTRGRSGREPAPADEALHPPLGDPRTRRRQRRSEDSAWARQDLCERRFGRRYWRQHRGPRLREGRVPVAPSSNEVNLPRLPMRFTRHGGVCHTRSHSQGARHAHRERYLGRPGKRAKNPSTSLRSYHERKRPTSESRRALACSRVPGRYQPRTDFSSP